MAQIILYADYDFGGQSVALDDSTPNLGDFNGLTSSFQVTDGVWQLYRGLEFNGPTGRPFGPGDYPSVDDVGVPSGAVASVRLRE